MRVVVGFVLCIVHATMASAACNGSDALCSKRYNQVTFLATRGSMASSDKHFVPPSQHFALSRQLSDGVRAFFIEVHEHKHTAYLCQRSCEFGSVSAFESFYEMALFMLSHPNEVVTLIIEEKTSAALVEKSLRESGLLKFVHTQTGKSVWPTLNEMIQLKETLVILSSAPYDSQYPWRHHFSEYATTIYDINLANPQAACSQPVDKTKLLAMHHSLDKPYVIERRTEMINASGFLSVTLRACIEKILFAPNFLAVDFYDLGNPKAAVNSINIFRAMLP